MSEQSLAGRTALVTGASRNIGREIALSLSRAGANIVDAQIYTTLDGLALDTIFVSREFTDDGDEERRGSRVSSLIEKTLAGRQQLPEQIERKALAKPRSKAFELPTDVIVNNSWSDRFTVIEVSGLDRPGLLYVMARTLHELQLSVDLAKIGTHFDQVIDVFYVTEVDGSKITDPDRLQAIRSTLQANLEAFAEG